MRAIATEGWPLLWSFKVFHTPHPLCLRKWLCSLSVTGRPSGVCAKLQVLVNRDWVLPYHPNWEPEVGRNVLYNKALACAAAPLFFVWGFANRISVSDSFFLPVLPEEETSSVLDQEVEATHGLGLPGLGGEEERG